jgi:hypothetical protein
MWDWITFGVCAGAVVPSVLLVAIFLRYILRNSERRCFKDSSEDCEILISTTTRPAPMRVLEVLHEFTHSQVVGPRSPTPTATRPSDPPPEYATTSADLTNSAELSNVISLLPPVYGSSSNISSVLPVYGSVPNVSSIPFNLNTMITSLDLLPEFATLPPPPTYDEAIRNHATF